MLPSRNLAVSQATAPGSLEPQEFRAELTLRESLRGYLMVNIALVAGLCVGFIHGWLKLRFRHPATTFAFDIFLVVALILVFLRCGSLRRFIPPGPVGKALLMLYALCALYFPFSLLSGTPPPLLALIAVRSWCFGSLMFCVGYHVIRSPVQLRTYLLLTVVLAFGTSVYGLRQSPEEIRALMEADPYFAARFMNQTYLTSQGSGQRIFSTFVSSAGYGSTLAVAMVFALILATETATRPLFRYLLYPMMGLMAYGIMQSGSRSSLAFAALGCGAVLAFRRQWLAMFLVPTLLAVALVLAGKATGGVLTERFSSLREFDSVALRFVIPAFIGLDYVLDGHPLGGGLGKSGFMPMFLTERVDYRDFVGADGDLGKLFIELGLPGFAIFAWLLFITGKLNWGYVRRHLSSPIGGLLLAGAVNFYISVISFPIGSPYIGIPMGMLVWFFLGASQKLVELEQNAVHVGAALEARPVQRPRIGIYGAPVPVPADGHPKRQVSSLVSKQCEPHPQSERRNQAPEVPGKARPAKIPFLYLSEKD